MRLIEALPVTASTRLAFVGAGGKSGGMFRLARQALADGLDLVLVSASTHLAVEQTGWADRHFAVKDHSDLAEVDFATLSGLVLVTGPEHADARTGGLPLALLDELAQIASGLGAPLLIEADGSRRKPLKAPAEHEPVVPEWATEVVVTAGLSGLGQPLDEEHVHRPVRFSALSGVEIGAMVTAEGLAAVLLSEQGGLKGIPPGARRSVLLNQADTAQEAGAARRLAEMLLPNYDQVIAARLRDEGNEVPAVHRQTAGVVLAAGGASRLGQPKQLLDWHGKPFIRAVAETALAAKLRPVLVVTGAYHAEASAVLDGLPVVIVHNPDWEQGQSTSVRAAVRVLEKESREAAAALFLLVDQPQIPVTLIRAVLDTYAKSLSPIVAPLVDNRRGNPVLFDRRTFSSLAAVEGDAGGRKVFSKFPVIYVPWLDARSGLDVDTLEDYQRLLEEG